MSDKFDFLDLDDLEKTLKTLYLQIILQDATIRELAVEIARLREHVKYIEDESDFPVWDRTKLRETLQIHYANLSELKMQAAIYAGLPPPELTYRINVVELEIDNLQQKLRANE